MLVFKIFVALLPYLPYNINVKMLLAEILSSYNSKIHLQDAVSKHFILKVRSEAPMTCRSGFLCIQSEVETEENQPMTEIDQFHTQELKESLKYSIFVPNKLWFIYRNIVSYYPVTTLTPIGVTSSPEVTAAKRADVTVSRDVSASPRVFVQYNIQTQGSDSKRYLM